MKLCTCGRPTDIPREPHRPVLCATCRHESNQARNMVRSWYRGDWSAASRAVRQAHPYCQRCLVKPSTEAHHVQARDGSGPVLALCSDCHHELHREGA